MRKRTFSILVAILALIASNLLVDCKSSDPDAKAAEISSATVAAVKRGSITHALSLAGQFQAYQVIDVHPKVSGFIKHIYVDIGDKVREGQTIAVLEVPELQAQLEGTVAQVGERRTRSFVPNTMWPGRKLNMLLSTRTTIVCKRQRKPSPV